MLAIEADGLRRTFRPSRAILRQRLTHQRENEVVAVERVDLAVQPGTIFGLLGPNGAGKTTTIKMLSTLLIPTSGHARVAGYDVARQEREVRRHLGVVLGGDRGLYNKLSARDNLTYFAHLYGLPRRSVSGRIAELLTLVGLEDRAADRVETFSRGMKQRLHLARALLHDPPVVFLDEPTIGLDPASAVSVRQIVRSLMPNHTVLLTTHYLQEADELCDRIAIIDRGRILVEDSPDGIKRRVGREPHYLVRVTGRQNGQLAGALERHPAIDEVLIEEEPAGATVYRLRCRQDSSVLDEAVRIVQGQGARIELIQAAEPTLEEAFLALTSGEDAR
jgi:ABC-2 type transport system ATP-binding protein